jgi:hypothetical protein
MKAADRETCMIFTCCIFVTVLFYFSGVGIAYGISLAASPNSNITSGCPNNNPDCSPHKKMMCYKNNMAACFIIAIPLIFLQLIVCVIIIWIFIVCYTLIFEQFVDTDSATEDKSVSLETDSSKSDSVIEIDRSSHSVSVDT